MGWGGKRPGSGKPKGTKQPKTLEKEAARELTRQLITANLRPLVLAQMANAVGISHLMLRNDDGTWRKATDDDDIEKALNGDPNRYWIATKDPNVQAFTDLMNRALDKPKEQPQDVEIKGDLVVRWQEEP